MDKKRVAITGMGVISPVGLDTHIMWENVVKGRSRNWPDHSFRYHWI